MINHFLLTKMLRWMKLHDQAFSADEKVTLDEILNAYQQSNTAKCRCTY